jgi:hypothetical protein
VAEEADHRELHHQVLVLVAVPPQVALTAVANFYEAASPNLFPRKLRRLASAVADATPLASNCILPDRALIHEVSPLWQLLMGKKRVSVQHQAIRINASSQRLLF